MDAQRLRKTAKTRYLKNI